MLVRLRWEIWVYMRVWYVLRRCINVCMCVTVVCERRWYNLNRLNSVHASLFQSMHVSVRMVCVREHGLDWALSTYCLIALLPYAEYGEWTVWNSLSYTLLSGVQSRQQAEQQCNEIGSKLTSLTTAAELTFVTTIQRSFTSWIG
jgi:hypothetical protein